MSQPHDGQRTFPFGNPFRMILPKGFYLPRKLLMLLNSFEETLAEKLNQLRPNDISDVLTLSWMTVAIEFLSDTHNHIKTLITDLQFPVSDWEEKWVDIYLNVSVKLLDVSIALSSELSRLDQGKLLLQYVVHVLDLSNFSTSEQLERAHASLNDWIHQINARNTKLENCCVILQGLADSLHMTKVKNSAKGKVLMRVLYGFKVITGYICSILVAALLGSSRPLMELKIPNKFVWAEAFNNLQGEVNKEMQTRLTSGKTTVLKELEAVETCVERFLASTVCFGEKELVPTQKSNGISDEMRTLVNCTNHEGEFGQQYASNLARSIERLTHDLGLLSKQVGDFFQIILTGRDALLCSLREPNMMEEQYADGSKLQGT